MDQGDIYNLRAEIEAARVNKMIARAWAKHYSPKRRAKRKREGAVTRRQSQRAEGIWEYNRIRVMHLTWMIEDIEQLIKEAGEQI